MTKLILGQRNDEYMIELWINGVKSENNRIFDNHYKALFEVCRIMEGLRLPLNVLKIEL